MKTKGFASTYGVCPFNSSVVHYLTTLEKWILYCSENFARGVFGIRLLALFVFIIGFPSITLSNIGAEWNPTGDPIGGGPGYSDSVRHQDADFVVYDEAQLLSALSNASYGDVIYVWDDCELDMTGSAYTAIPSGVTLASGRGRTLGDTISWGALIYFNNPGYFNGDIFKSSNGGKMRITGFRFRGSYSEIEGYVTGYNNFAQPVPWETGIAIHHDSCEVDNCEFWGFGKAAINLATGEGSYIHHCYIHHCRHVYHGYSIQFAGDSKGVVEACYGDDLGALVIGSTNTSSSYEARYNISGKHGGANAYERHNNVESPPMAAADYIHHNTVRFTGFSNGPTGYRLCGYAVDSVLVHNNWFWAEDSVHVFDLYSDSLVSIWNSAFTETPPSGLSGRIPTANIVASCDSGNLALTVTFSAIGSSDPDGNLIAFYWNFGDSCKIDNWARYSNINNSVEHTYTQIGKYTVTLMVVDNHGIPSYAYKTINVKPSNTDSSYLSCWIKDRFYDSPSGYYSKQILINDWVCWTKDIAGGGTWEHVVVNITDSLQAWQTDSVTLRFRLYCTRDTASYKEAKMYIDEVSIYGADVLNGAFESGIWTGTSKCTDGVWIAADSHNGVYYRCWDWYLDTNGGDRAYYLGKSVGPHSAGNWAQVSQKVAITGMGITPSNGDTQVCSLYVPYPNPALQNAMIAYQIPIQSDISTKIYDANGRLVKTLVSEKQESGFYQINWDGRDDHSRRVAAGVYFCKFIAEPIDTGEKYSETKKVVFLR